MQERGAAIAPFLYAARDLKWMPGMSRCEYVIALGLVGIIQVRIVSTAEKSLDL